MENEQTPVVPVKRKSFLVTFFYSMMWGVFGVDRFYLGKYFTGFLKLITAGGFGLWAMVDMGAILSGAMKDKHGNYLEDYDKYVKLARKTILFFSLIVLVLAILFIAAIVFTVQMLIAQLSIPGIDWQSFIKMFTDTFTTSNLQQIPENLNNIPNEINNVQF